MPIETTDVRSNPEEQIKHAAKAVGRGADRQKVFLAIISGKKRYKKISEIEKITGLHRKRVLEETVKLFNKRIFNRKKIDGEWAYEKDGFLAQYKELILRLAGSPKRLEAFPTKSNPRTITVVQHVTKSTGRLPDAKRITIDDIESFSRARGVSAGTSGVPIKEKSFKDGLKAILREEGEFQDWGGESDDLFTTRLVIAGSRKAAAFGLKGKGTRGILYANKMGKRGDQIQRLFGAPAEVFLVQYWGQVDERVYELMEKLATAKSIGQGNRIYWGVIDGGDTARLVKAYPACFASAQVTKGNE
jgi:hypothetical protein